MPISAQPPASLPGARLLFSLEPSVAHLNHGSFGAVPIGVQRAQRRLADEVEANPMRFFSRGLRDRLAHTARHVAAFLGADPEGTALAGNASAAIAVVLGSLDLRAGDEIVLTNHGYDAVALAAAREARRHGAVVRTVPLPLGAPDDAVVAAVRAAATPGRTRLVIVDHITSPTAWLLPVAPIVAALRDLGVPVLVDAAHSPGMLPLAVDQLGADFWVGNLHKWAYAPRGTAALVVAPAWRERVEPLVVSHAQPDGFPMALQWQGTLDYTAWLAAPVALFTLRTLGPEAVRAHNAALARYGQQVVGAALGVAPLDLPDLGSDLGMRLIPLPEGAVATAEQAQALRIRIAAELAAEVAISAWSGRGLLRLSAQVYNIADEYEKLADGLPRLLGQRATRQSAPRS